MKDLPSDVMERQTSKWKFPEMMEILPIQLGVFNVGFGSSSF